MTRWMDGWIRIQPALKRKKNLTSTSTIQEPANERKYENFYVLNTSMGKCVIVDKTTIIDSGAAFLVVV